MHSYTKGILSPWSKQDEFKPLELEKAVGIYLYLTNGHRLIDAKSQSFSANLGHAHPYITAKICESARNVSALNFEYYCQEREKLAARLTTHFKSSKVFFTLGGAEANENAIKIARLYNKKHKIITRYKSYHGASMQTISISGDYRRIPFDNYLNSGVIRIPDSNSKIWSIDLLEEIIQVEGPETICAMLLEGVVGANGVIVPHKNYFAQVLAVCEKYDIILIADEILSGFFRTGHWAYHSKDSLPAHIITLSKGLTAGYAPLGAVLVCEKITKFFEQNTLWCGLTQYGNFLSCAAANAALDIYETDDFQKNIQEISALFSELLQSLKNKFSFIKDVRHAGMLSALDLIDIKSGEPIAPYRASSAHMAKAKLLNNILKLHEISALVRFGTLILAPPLIMTKDELCYLIKQLENAFDEFGQKN